MLKLKYLFNNQDLAHMLLMNWQYDEPSLGMFKDYRISANAIYPFKINEETCFLRFCPITEKQKGNITAELDFVSYLHRHGYNALEAVPSKTGEKLIQASTPWGEYYASVFRCVRGKQISATGFENEILFAYGESLGNLHKLSRDYNPPKAKRWTHLDVFNWIEQNLQNLPAEDAALNELALLRLTFAALAVHPASYGLIHFDFELDNVFYEPATHSCHVIDFDDAMYHWYVMDIERSLDSLKSEMPVQDFEQKKTVFLEGYRTRYEVNADLLAAMPIFRRFANLYGYTRIVRSVQDSWENEPEWLMTLRTRLEAILTRRSADFGKPINAFTHSQG